MKKKALPVIVLVLVLALTLSACSDSSTPQADDVIGSVNGLDLYQSEYDYYFNNIFSSIYNEYYQYYLVYYGVDLLDEESARELLGDLEYYAWNALVEAALIRQMSSEEYSLEAVETYLVDVVEPGQYLNIQISQLYNELYALVEQELLDALVIDDAAIREAYEADPEHWNTRTTSHILFMADPSDEAAMTEARQRAEAVLAELAAGGDFAALAQEHSDDSSAANGGVIASDFNIGGSDPVTGGSLYAEYVAAAFTLAQVGDYTLEPVESQSGYHIIKLDSITEGLEANSERVGTSLKTVSQDEVTAAINDKLQQRFDAADIQQSLTFKYYVEAAEEPGEDGAAGEDPAEGEDTPLDDVVDPPLDDDSSAD